MSSESSTEAAANATPGPADADFWFIWFIAWLGITAAGGLFGLIAGSISGMLIGPFIAAFFAVPVVFTIAVITWAFWLTRFSVIMAAVAGASTGIISTAVFWDPIFETEFGASLALAACIGATISGLMTGFYWRKSDQRAQTVGPEHADWHYSLRDLFLRFTIVTVLIATWTFVINKYLSK